MCFIDPGILGGLMLSMDVFDMVNLFPFYYLKVSHCSIALRHRVLGHELCKTDS